MLTNGRKRRLSNHEGAGSARRTTLTGDAGPAGGSDRIQAMAANAVKIRLSLFTLESECRTFIPRSATLQFRQRESVAGSSQARFNQSGQEKTGGVLACRRRGVLQRTACKPHDFAVSRRPEISSLDRPSTQRRIIQVARCTLRPQRCVSRPPSRLLGPPETLDTHEVPLLRGIAIATRCHTGRRSTPLVYRCTKVLRKLLFILYPALEKSG